jgi:hypothetical protein
MVGNGMLVDAGVNAFWLRVFVILPLVTAASVAVGFAFHNLVERHFMGQPPLWRGASGGDRQGVALDGRVAVKAA